MDPIPLPPPGWYPDPDGRDPSRHRWWDGTRWSDHFQPAGTVDRQWTTAGQPSQYVQQQSYRPFPPAKARRQPIAWGKITFVLLGTALVAWLLIEAPWVGRSNAITGTFILLDGDDQTTGSCSGDGGYADVQAGLGVVVKDGEGRTLGNDSLGPGTRGALGTCNFGFIVTGVPRADFYAVSVGRRGELTYSYDEMVAANWDVTLSLGE